MTIPNRLEHESRDTPASVSGTSGSGNAETSDNPKPLTGGAWLSFGLSVAFYLLMLALGAKYTGEHPVHGRPAEPDRSARASPMAYAPAIASTLATAVPVDEPALLLTRAHDCAASGQWDCVIDATSGVIAQRGNTPVARALLAQAMIQGGWSPASTSTASLTGRTHNVRPVSMMPPGAKRVTKREHRHTVRAAPLRYASTTQSNPERKLAYLYRH